MNRAKIYIKSEISETDATISFNLPWYHGMASDFSNIRFFMSPYRIIPHWIESYTSDSAKVWIKLPSIHPGINIVFVEWGNWNSGKGSGKQTFVAFDHFDDNSIDSILWDYQNGIWTESNSYAYVETDAGAAPGNILRSNIWLSSYKVRALITVGSSFGAMIVHAQGVKTNPWLTLLLYNTGDEMRWYYYNGSNHTLLANTTQTYNTGDQILLEISVNGGSLTAYDLTNNVSLSVSHTLTEGYIGLRDAAAQTTFSKFDYWHVRKYLDPEPEVIDIRPVRYSRYMIYELLKSVRQYLQVFTLVRELIPKSTKTYTQVREITERLTKTYTGVIEAITKNVQNYTQIRESVEKTLKEFTQIKEIAERDLKSYTQILETAGRLLKIYPEIVEIVPKTLEVQTEITEVTERDLKTFTKITEIVLTSLKTVDKLQYLKSSHNVIIYNNVFPFPAMKIDSATTNENVTIYTSLNAPEQKNYTVFTIPAGTEDTIIESDPISLTGSISISFEGSLPSNATAYVSVNNTLYQMKNIGNYYYRTVRDITSSDTVKFIIKSTSADTDTKVFIRNIQIENTDEPTAYVSAGSSRDAGFLSYNFDPEKIKAIMLYVYTPESSNEKTILYMPASNVYLHIKGSKVYLNDAEILDWANDQWNLVYIDSNGVRVNTDSYSITINLLSDTLYVAQKNGENHLNGFISMLTFLKKELSDPVKVMSSLIVR